MERTWKSAGQQFVYTTIDPLIRLLSRIGVTPNMITMVGFILNAAAAIVFVMGAEWTDRTDHRYVAWGGLTILLAGLMDMVDGRLARVANLSSTYGALFDSVLDRYSEMVMFLGICYYFIAQDYFFSSLFAFVAMIGSIMVSYVRARAEGLGVDCSVGIMQRPERILLIGISALLCGLLSYAFGYYIKIDVDWFPTPIFESILIFSAPIAFLAISANITAVNRMLHTRKELQEKGL